MWKTLVQYISHILCLQRIEIYWKFGSKILFVHVLWKQYVIRVCVGISSCWFCIYHLDEIIILNLHSSEVVELFRWNWLIDRDGENYWKIISGCIISDPISDAGRLVSRSVDMTSSAAFIGHQFACSPPPSGHMAIHFPGSGFIVAIRQFDKVGIT